MNSDRKTQSFARKLMIGFAILFLVLGLFGLGHTLWKAHDNISKTNWWEDSITTNYYTSIVFALISFSIVVLIWEKIQSAAAGNIADELALNVIARASRTDFQIIKKEDAYRIAAFEIQTAKRIKIVGYAKAIEQNTASKYAKAYLDNTELRLKKDKEVMYQRICSCDMPPIFQQHIRKCIGSNSQAFNLILLPEFQPPHTWLIIDDRVYMLILNHHETAEEPCYITRDPAVIRKLDSHFNDLWTAHSGNGVIRSLKDYDSTLAKWSRIGQLLNRIITDYMKYKKSGIMSDFIESSYAELSDYLERMPSHQLEIDHSSSTSSLLNSFSMYMKKMTLGDEYYVITTIGIWRKIKHEDGREAGFYNANTEAIKKGISINRILILDYNITNTDNGVIVNNKEQADAAYKAYQTKEIIKDHVNWMDQRSNYNFKILFMKSYNDRVAAMDNFTLVKYNSLDEAVLFLPQTNDSGKVTRTRLNFNSKNVSTRKSYFDDRITKVNNQDIEKGHIDFLVSIDPFFEKPENLIRVIGKDKPNIVS